MRRTNSPKRGPVAVVLVLAAACVWACSGAAPVRAGEPAGGLRPFLEAHCVSCHDPASKRGGLDLQALTDDVSDPAAFGTWIKVHDRARAGEMPPPSSKEPRPPRAETDAVVRALGARLADADRARREGQGRSVVRRLNRAEYENTLRDLLGLPGLNVRDLLPEDGRAAGFDKVGAGLDISHVQLAKYLEAADVVLDQAIATQLDAPEVYRDRILAGTQLDFDIVASNGDAVFLKNGAYDHAAGLPVPDDSEPMSVYECFQKKIFPYNGTVGVFRHEDEAFRPRFHTFCPIYPGRYKLRLSVWSFQWDKGAVRPALRTEAAALIQGARVLKYFDAPSLAPRAHELVVWLDAGQYVRFNAASLWLTHVSLLPGRAKNYVGPGIAVDWLEVEGPLNESWPPPSHRRLFSTLPLKPLPLPGDARQPRRVPPKQAELGKNQPGKVRPAAVAPKNPEAVAGHLLSDFLPRAFRRPVSPDEVARYVDLVRQRLDARVSFEEAMRTAYKAALCAPDFLFFREDPGPLDDRALACRLSYFLWNSMPDDVLYAVADAKTLHDPATLRAQVMRMLADPRAGRFVEDFLAQWLDLREIDATSPDTRLYPEFSPYLRDSMLAETRAFFHVMLRGDLSVANVVDSDFAVVNQKMAEHYGIPGVAGTAFRRVPLPPGSPRGGFLTQASVLKVTANGTVTSPVKRGVWVRSKILGQPPEPPPPNLPAIEPDVRGATTVRQLLDKHRASTSCATCHVKIDPPGYALENFDVIGGWQDHYRSLGDTGDAPAPERTSGHPVQYRLALPVDATGQTAPGRAFKGITGFKAILLEDDRALARNLVNQLITYATGAPVSFADRDAVERILDQTAPGRYGVRSLILAVVQSELFQSK